MGCWDACNGRVYGMSQQSIYYIIYTCMGSTDWGDSRSTIWDVYPIWHLKRSCKLWGVCSSRWNHMNRRLSKLVSVRAGNIFSSRSRGRQTSFTPVSTWSGRDEGRTPRNHLRGSFRSQIFMDLQPLNRLRFFFWQNSTPHCSLYYIAQKVYCELMWIVHFSVPHVESVHASSLASEKEYVNWWCQMMPAEAGIFRRQGSYRHSSCGIVIWTGPEDFVATWLPHLEPSEWRVVWSVALFATLMSGYRILYVVQYLPSM